MSALPRRVRKDIDRILEEGEINLESDLAIWEIEERRRALRVAVLLPRDMRIVAYGLAHNAMAAGSVEERKRLLASSEPMAEALAFAASELCWTMHNRVFGTW